MKALFTFSLALLLLGSCTKYQHVSVDSALGQNEQKEFAFENDTVRIVYAFAGKLCPVQLTVYNKSGQPLYLDWRKAALIVEDKSFPLWQEKTIVDAYTHSTEIQWSNERSQTTTTTAAAVTAASPLVFLPPKASVSWKPMYLKKELFNTKALRGEKTKVATTKGSKKAVAYAFDPASSPLRFRIFLGLSPREDFSKPIFVDQSFWVGEILQTRVPGFRLAQHPGDRFELSGLTSTGGVLSGIIVVVALLAVFISRRVVD